MGTRRPKPRSLGSSGPGFGGSGPIGRERAERRTEVQARQVARTSEGANGVKRLDTCRVCGKEFDASRYQVVIAALGDAPFDRIECADTAMAERAAAELLARRRRRRR